MFKKKASAPSELRRVANNALCTCFGIKTQELVPSWVHLMTYVTYRNVGESKLKVKKRLCTSTDEHACPFYAVFFKECLKTVRFKTTLLGHEDLRMTSLKTHQIVLLGGAVEF